MADKANIKLQKPKNAKIEKIKKQKTLSIISMAVVFIGALDVGICLLLSEILYPKIEEFFKCPIWYQIFMYVSLAVAVGGIVGCAFTKNRQNTTKLECHVEMGLFWIGFFCMIVCALVRSESYVLDVFICIGGAICSVGFFCGIGSFIGRLKKQKDGPYATIYYRSIPYQNLPALPFAATLSQIMEVEKYFGTMLPNELVDFLLEFNGDGDLLFSTNEIVDKTKLVRETIKDKVDKFCFFGADKAGEEGNLFCYKILDDGSIKAGEIYLWNNKTNEIKLVATTLKDLIVKYYSDEMKKENKS